MASTLGLQDTTMMEDDIHVIAHSTFLKKRYQENPNILRITNIIKHRSRLEYFCLCIPFHSFQVLKNSSLTRSLALTTSYPPSSSIQPSPLWEFCYLHHFTPVCSQNFTYQIYLTYLTKTRELLVFTTVFHHMIYIFSAQALLLRIALRPLKILGQESDFIMAYYRNILYFRFCYMDRKGCCGVGI